MNPKNLEHRIPILIPVFNNLEYTQKAVASLMQHTDPNLYECLIIDNGSTDDTPQYIKSMVETHPSNFRCIRLEKNLGFGGGLNRGLEAISSLAWEYAVIANNDLIFTPKWLEHMLDAMTTIPIPKLGLVGPMSNFAGGTQGMEANYRTSNDLVAFAESHYARNKGHWHEAGVVVGLLMLFSRAFFNDVGLFDERFFPGTWEENDWELRGALKGWRYAVDRSTFIHHYGSKTIQTVEDSKDQRKNFVTNRTRFREKWNGPESPYEALAKERYLARGMDPEAHKTDGRYRKWVVAACRVKNGSQWMERTLSRVSEFADEIVILVDQATTDNTEEICSRFPKVVAMEKEPPHEYNEAWSRNRVLNMAFARNPDWIYCFDADEVIEQRAVARREELTDPVDPSIMMWVQPIVQLWNTEHTQRVDGLWGSFYQGRMFRVLPGQKIENANNLIHCGSTPSIPQDRHGFSYFRIIHYGNVDPTIRAGKYEWYTKTDTDKDLGMALGGHRDHYWRLYYGQPTAEEVQACKEWKVAKDDPNWSRPAYGTFYERDVYRHVKDETGLVLVPFDEKPTVTLCMLVKDEANFLPRAVSSVRPFINELIVIDTGSVDGSDHVAERLGAKVYPFKWVDDFSAARNFSLSKATGDWILRIDPDEVIPWQTATQIPLLVREHRMEGYVFPIMNWLEDPHVGKPNTQWALSETCRLYRNLYPTVHYTNPVHEELDDTLKALSDKRIKDLIDAGMVEADAKEKGKVMVSKVPFQIWHYGYLRGREFLDKKFNYYYQLGKKHIAEQPEDARPYFNTSVHLLHTRNYLAAAEGYKKTVEMDDRNHMAWNDLGVLYMTVTGELGLAEKCFAKALTCMNEHTHAEHRTRVERNLEEVKIRILSKMLKV